MTLTTKPVLFGLVFAASLCMSSLVACSPKVQIVPSDKPIKIDLNVNITQELRIRLDQDVEDLIANNPDLF